MAQAVQQERGVAAMHVPLLDLKPQYRALKPEIDAAILAVCESQSFILGPAVKRLERRVAEMSQCRHGIGVSSGTDALLIALMVLDIGVGDEVVTTPYTFFATGGTIARVGARPVYCDVERGSFNLSPTAVRRFLETECERRGDHVVNRRTGGVVRALMPVHLYGQLADMPQLMQIAREYGLRVIEDAAQAIGAGDGAGRRACSFGDIGCLSFFPTKNLGAFGDAGMCVTNDDALAEKLEIYRVHGSKPKYYHAFVGGNFRIDEIQAAVLDVKVAHLDAWTSARQRNAAFYDRALATSALRTHVVAPPPASDGARHIYNQYVIRATDRDGLRAHLTKCNIGTEIYYPVPLHLQQCFTYLGGERGQCPEAEQAAAESLALPIYPELSPDQLGYVVRCVAQFYGVEG
jgi:dTDP-4-amino-4,6-dideoxygalactose transaminase